MKQIKITIEDNLLSFNISENNKDLDYLDLDKLNQVKILSALCNALEFFLKHTK